MRSSIKITAAACALTAMAATGAVALGLSARSAERSAPAAASTTTAPAASVGCVSNPDRTLNNVYENPAGLKGCPKGFMVSLSRPGPSGPAGPKGATGPAGPSGAQAVQTAALTPASQVPTGGSFNSKAVVVGTESLKAGTYLVSLSAQSEPSADTSAAGVQPQFFLYDQVKNAAFTGDLLNIGSGTLAPAGTHHDSYASGTAVITLSSDTTLYVYGFGYDNDTGASDYSLIAGSLTAVKLTPAA